ncbi:type II secretion system protein J [Mycoavidus sp. B2-EB]|uniref:PulJ/GspJ family protein n=1 Tax=Mycoavidus sp. B2-EB TaxID=2651972 RepID=UPI00162775C6|nr:prepilin-type N-terminal cleavage/methylation domain-containing protein [Mycoavidus sp. B2-EB]BBO58953.1 general secretory pathway protein GspJ [Mycoavidus sp. B2-EB]
MKRNGRYKYQIGFTLVELLVTMTILALVAILSWRGLDQIVRARDAVTLSMANERALAQFFDQVGIDVRQAALERDLGQPAIVFGAGQLQIVRQLNVSGQAPRLQVVRYQVPQGRVLRLASPPLATFRQLQAALAVEAGMEDWSTVELINGVRAVSVRGWVRQLGWTANMQDVQAAFNKNLTPLTALQARQIPSERSMTGIKLTVHVVKAQHPLTRILLVGE